MWGRGHWHRVHGRESARRRGPSQRRRDQMAAPADEAAAGENESARAARADGRATSCRRSDGRSGVGPELRRTGRNDAGRRRSAVQRMPRLPRFVVPDPTLHVVQRGSDRAPAYVGADDPRFFPGCSLRASREHAVAIDACVLTGNDVHLPAKPGDRRRVGRQGSVRATPKVESDPSSRSPAARGARAGSPPPLSRIAAPRSLRRVPRSRRNCPDSSHVRRAPAWSSTLLQDAKPTQHAPE